MKNLKDFIASGILELHVLGDTSDEEDAEVLIMASKFPAQIAREIAEISMALEYLALENAVQPSRGMREAVFARISEMDRRPEIPPLTHFSKIEDYTRWFDPEDLVTPEGFEGVRLKVLGHTDRMTTFLIIATALEGEVHHDLYERLLVIEGTCNVIIENKVHSFEKGDFINIPLHKWHDVEIPYGIPCKAILQRIPV